MSNNTIEATGIRIKNAPDLFYLSLTFLHVPTTGYSLNIVVFFSRILKSLPPLPSQHTAAIGSTKNSTFLVWDLMTPPLPPLLGVENVKIRENSEKNQGTSGGSLGTLYNPI